MRFRALRRSIRGAGFDLLAILLRWEHVSERRPVSPKEFTTTQLYRIRHKIEFAPYFGAAEELYLKW